MGQLLLIGIGASLTTGVAILSLPEVVNANKRTYCYFNRALKKAEGGDDSGVISDYTKTIELDSEDSLASYNRGIAMGN